MTDPTRPGRLVSGRYRLVSQIGGGGMGAVWLAHDDLLGRDVAVKEVLMPPGMTPALADEQRELVLREGRIAARLSHPHAIPVYDAALDGGQPWLVMEHLPSRSLAEVLTEDGLLPVDQVAQIGAQVADALAAAHAAGVVHRDVKPANILIGQRPGEEGLVKITDFGIARARGDVRLTQTGIVKGTPAFLAPEVARGEEPDPPSDVFSLGATLFTCLEGEPPFGLAENSLRLLHRVAAGDMEPPRHAGAMTRPLLRMLDLDPAARPTMTQVRDELATLAARRLGDVTTVLTTRALIAPIRPPGPAADHPIPGERTATRTDLPAVGPLTSAPAGPPTGGPVAAVPIPVAPRPVPTPRSPAPSPGVTGTPRSARRRWPVAAAGLVLLALVALGVWLVPTLTRDDGGDGATATSTSESTSAPTSEAAPATSDPVVTDPPSSEPTQPSTTPPAAPTPEAPAPPPAAEPGAVTARDVERALDEYYELLPEDVEAAFARTGPSLQDYGFADYSGFFADYEKVDAGRIEAQDGSLVATAEVTFTANDGERSREQHEITLVQGPNEELLVDRDVPVATLE